MLKGSKLLVATSLGLLGLSVFAQEAAAGQWYETGRTAFSKTGFGASFYQHTCDTGTATLQGYPGTCPNDAAGGWTVNFNASAAYSNSQIRSCNFNAQQEGSACYGIAYAINGQSYPGDLPATTCSIGARAVVTWDSIEVVKIQYDELDVDTAELAREYVCQ